MTRREYYKMWSRFQIRYERKYIPRIRKVLDNQMNQWKRNKSIDHKEMADLLTQLYIDTGVQWAAKLYTFLPKRKARLPMGLNERVIQLMKDVLGINIEILADELTQTTVNYITKELEKAFETGLSIDDIVDNLIKSGLNYKRARVIARTETVGAANEAGFQYANSQGLNMRKTWLSVRDNRTRESHLEIDGTTLPMNEPFNVRGELMMQPGARKQPDGTDVKEKEFIQCRCTLIYEVMT